MNTINVIGTHLYQWDLGRKLSIEPVPGVTIQEVHFSVSDSGEALVVQPNREGDLLVADIPNILLQSGDNLIVHTMNVSEGKVETIRERTLLVRKRAKPSNYVYTETEVLNYIYLDRRIDYLEHEGLEKAVSDYLDEHPVEGVTEDELVSAVNDALQQAKESGEFDGPAGPVGPQGPAGAPGANGTSVSHWWDGTVLYIESASGTSSADLRGPAGEGSTADVAPLFVSVTADMVIDCPVSDIYDAVMSSRPVYLIGYDQNGRYMIGLCVGIVDNSFVFTPYISGDGQFLVYSVALDTGAVSMLDAAAVFGEQFSSVIYEALAQAKASGEFDGADGKDGEDGADGITPHIGANGNWFIGNTDTGKPSRGADGKDGAQGEQGIQGVQGEKVTPVHLVKTVLTVLTAKQHISTQRMAATPVLNPILR